MKIVEKSLDVRQLWIEMLPMNMAYGTFKIVGNYYTKQGNLLCAKTIVTIVKKNQSISTLNNK